MHKLEDIEINTSVNRICRLVCMDFRTVTSNFSKQKSVKWNFTCQGRRLFNPITNEIWRNISFWQLFEGIKNFLKQYCGTCRNVPWNIFFTNFNITKVRSNNVAFSLITHCYSQGIKHLWSLQASMVKGRNGVLETNRTCIIIFVNLFSFV